MKKDMYKIGIVKFVDHASLNRLETGLARSLDALSEKLGVRFDYDGMIYDGQADPAKMAQAAMELVAKGADLVFSIATPTSVVMKDILEQARIPMVFQAVSDPVTANLIASFQHPGAYITGTSDALDGALLVRMMLAVHPEFKKVGLLYGTGELSSKLPVEEMKAALTEHGVAYIERGVDSIEQVEAAAKELAAQKVEAVLTPTDNTVMSAELQISPILTAAHIPQFTGSHAFVINGAFFGLGGSYRQNEIKSMEIVEDILVNGISPMDIPVARASHDYATINNQICAQLGYDKGTLEQIFSKEGLRTVFLDSQEEFDPDSE